MTIKGFEAYKENLEKQYGKEMVEILEDFYIKRDLGPSTSAKMLGVPRGVVLHYINLYRLKAAKHQLIKKSASLEEE